jgi:hypothetical protein
MQGPECNDNQRLGRNNKAHRMASDAISHGACLGSSVSGNLSLTVQVRIHYCGCWHCGLTDGKSWPVMTAAAGYRALGFAYLQSLPQGPCGIAIVMDATALTALPPVVQWNALNRNAPPYLIRCRVSVLPARAANDERRRVPHRLTYSTHTPPGAS